MSLQLIGVGKRHCRVLISANNNSDATGFDIKRDRQLAKFWINPVSIEKNRGFKEHELNQIARLVEEYEQTLLEAWHDYFDT